MVIRLSLVEASLEPILVEGARSGLPVPRADAKRPLHPIGTMPVQRQSGRSSGVEHNLAKVGVEGSNPFARSSILQRSSAPLACHSM